MTKMGFKYQNRKNMFSHYVYDSIVSIRTVPPQSGLPRSAVFVIGNRVDGNLLFVVAGWIRGADSNVRRRWAVSAATLRQGKFNVSSYDRFGLTCVPIPTALFSLYNSVKPV